MRYVIVIVGLALLIIWDALYNGGQYSEVSVRTVRNLVRSVTG